MSKGLSRVRALVSEIDAIQTQGRKISSQVPLMRAVQSESVASQSKLAPEAPVQVAPVAAPAASEVNNVVSMRSRAVETASVAAPEGKIFLQLTGKIAIQLQLEHSEEIVEVRQQGETIEIRFTDGKAIHLPLKNVA